METDKARQLRRAQDLEKNVAATQNEEADESVHSPDQLQAAGDEHQKDQKKKNTYSRHRPSESEDKPEDSGLDLTA